MVSVSALRRSSLTFRFSLSLAASFGWLNRNMLVLPSRITAPGPQHNRQEVKTLHTTLKTTIIKDIFTVRSWREATDEVCDVSPWLSCDGCVTWTPFTEHWAPPSGTRVTLPFWFSNMQCSLSRSRPCRTAGGGDDTGHTWRLWASQKTNCCTTTTNLYRSSVWDGRVKES